MRIPIRKTCVLRRDAHQDERQHALALGVQDSPEHVAEWLRLGPEAVLHARKALALGTGRAAAVYADAFQYMRPAFGTYTVYGTWWMLSGCTPLYACLDLIYIYLHMRLMHYILTYNI